MSHKQLEHLWDGLPADSWKSHLIPLCLSFPPQKMDHPSHFARDVPHVWSTHTEEQALILSGALRSHYKRNKVQHSKSSLGKLQPGWEDVTLRCLS